MALNTVRLVVFMLVPVLLAACGTNTDIVDRRLIAKAANPLAGSGESNPTAEEIRARITPELRQQLGDRPLAITTLEDAALSSIIFQVAVNKDVATFFTPDNRSLSFREGVLVATRGLGFDLMISGTGDAADLGAAQPGEYSRVYQYIDGDETILSLDFQCSWQGRGPVRETCRGDWGTIENTYTFSVSGDIVASRQWVGPERGYIRIEPAFGE